MWKGQEFLGILNSGGQMITKDPLTNTDRLEVSRTGRSSRIQSKMPNGLSSMTKFKKSQTKVEVSGNWLTGSKVENSLLSKLSTTTTDCVPLWIAYGMCYTVLSIPLLISVWTSIFSIKSSANPPSNGVHSLELNSNQQSASVMTLQHQALTNYHGAIWKSSPKMMTALPTSLISLILIST